MKKAIFVLIILAALAGCSHSEPGIISNPKILAQLEPVIKLSLMDGNNLIPLKRSDLDALNRSVMHDPRASHRLEEMYWMIDHNETEHIAHTIGALEEYLKTGRESFCAPHELWHAALRLKHNDAKGVEHSIEDASESFSLWAAQGEGKRGKFPQFYVRFDAQKEEAAYLIGQLRKGNYSDALVGRIKTLGESAVC